MGQDDNQAEPLKADSRGVAPPDRLVLPYPVALLAVALTYWTIDIVSPALPVIKRDLGLSAAGAGLVFSLLFAGRLAGNLPAAWLLERRGAAVTAVLGGATLALGSLIAAIAPGPLILMAGRIVQGGGISLLVNAGLRSILLARPAAGAAMTFFTVAATIGGIFGLQSGGYLTEWRGWRAVFVLCLLLAISLTILSAGVLRSGRTAARESIAGAQPSAISPVSYALLAIPLVVNFAVFFNYSTWVALPLYTEQEFGASAGTNANLLFIITLVHLVLAIPAGRLIRTSGSRRVLVGALIVALAGTLGIALAPAIAVLPVPLLVYGAGQVAAVSAAGDIVLQRGQGSGRSIGALRLSSDLGLVVGPFVAGALADAFGYRAPFLALPVLMAVAVVLAIGMVGRSDAPVRQGG